MAIGTLVWTVALRLPATFWGCPTVRRSLVGDCGHSAGRHSSTASTGRRLQEFLNTIFEIPPVREPNVDRGNFPLPIDQEGGRQRVHAAVLPGSIVVADHHPVIHFQIREEWLDGFPALVVHGHAEHFETLVLILALHLHKPRDLNAAGAAPGGPEKIRRASCRERG